MNKHIFDITPTPKESIRKRRVAAYARVSCGKDAMLHSLAAQIDYYRDFIRNNPDWDFAGVYADEAKTGTKEDREQFQRLLADCRAGANDKGTRLLGGTAPATPCSSGSQIPGRSWHKSAEPPPLFPESQHDLRRPEVHPSHHPGYKCLKSVSNRCADFFF